MITVEIDWVWAIIILIVLAINTVIEYSRLAAAKEERDASNTLLTLFLQGIVSVSPSRPIIDGGGSGGENDDNDSRPSR